MESNNNMEEMMIFVGHLILMESKFITWNVRGTVGKTMIINMKRVVKKFKPWIIGLQEIKMTVVDDF